MARKTDPVARARADLRALDQELAGLQQQARQTQDDLQRARRTMAEADMDEGLAQARQGREHAADLAELINAKRAQRDQKAQELAGAQADQAVAELQQLRAERSQAVAETVAAAHALRAALDRLHDARQAVKTHLGGMTETQYATALSEADPAQLVHWVGANRKHFEFATAAEGLDPDGWAQRVDRPSDHPAVIAGLAQYRESCRQQAEARLAEPASGQAADSEPAA
jgi:hypothetical protein